jgi:lysophospholipase L1-like esterase
MTLARPVLWLAAAAVLGTTAGCAAWRMGTAAQLARQSEPFQANPSPATASLLVVGDSTAVGTGATDAARSVPGLLAASRPGLRVVNLARDGARYAEFAQQLQRAEGRFDHVLVLGGGNDVIRLTGQAQLREDVRRTAEAARRISDHVILMPPGNVGNAPFFFAPVSWWMDRRSQALHAAVRDAAGATGARYVGLYKDRQSDPFAQRPQELHASDGLHPSDAGYRLWVEELQRQGGLGPR